MQSETAWLEIATADRTVSLIRPGESQEPSLRGKILAVLLSGQSIRERATESLSEITSLTVEAESASGLDTELLASLIGSSAVLYRRLDASTVIQELEGQVQRIRIGNTAQLVIAL